MSVQVHPATYETVGEVIEAIFKRAAEPGGALADVAGRTVFVKPNILGPFDPERGITTHPAVVGAVTRALLKRGAKVVVGDNPGMQGYGAGERSARRSGILEAVGDCWQHIGIGPAAAPTSSRFIDRLMVSRIALEADLYVSVPKFKTHVTTVITGAIKNSYGLLVGGQKALLHREARGARAFAEAVIDVFAVRPPDFVVMDGIVAMQGKGPSGKDLRDLNLILAGTNAVEVDAVMATIMGVAPSSIPLLREARRRGLGQINVRDIDVEGPVKRVRGFKVPYSRSERWIGALMARLAAYLVVGRPAVKETECVRCGLCARQCPVGAVALNPYPEIDHDRCILCYCCNEFCEYDAMDVRHRLHFVRRPLRLLRRRRR